MQQQQKQNVTGKPITNKNSQKIVSDFFYVCLRWTFVKYRRDQFYQDFDEIWQPPFAVVYSRRSDSGVKRELKERGDYEEKRERERL